MSNRARRVYVSVHAGPPCGHPKQKELSSSTAKQMNLQREAERLSLDFLENRASGEVDLL